MYGSNGQLNYSSSNAFRDGLTRHRRALGKVAMTPQWGAWGDVGKAANLDDASRRRLANSQMPYFSNAEGLYGLECGLRSNLPYFGVYKLNSVLLVGMIYPDDFKVPVHASNMIETAMPNDFPSVPVVCGDGAPADVEFRDYLSSFCTIDQLNHTKRDVSVLMAVQLHVKWHHASTAYRCSLDAHGQ